MFQINDNFQKLPGSYLFSTIAKKVAAYQEANPDNAVLQIKSLEAFAKAADGKATKIIIPSEIQGIAGLTKSIAEIAADKTEK